MYRGLCSLAKVGSCWLQVLHAFAVASFSPMQWRSLAVAWPSLFFFGLCKKALFEEVLQLKPVLASLCAAADHKGRTALKAVRLANVIDCGVAPVHFWDE